MARIEARGPTDHAKRAVVTVGDGRGFIVESMGRRLVVTAAPG
jgi:hypothetical protein